jgi:hypothetical protein
MINVMCPAWTERREVSRLASPDLEDVGPSAAGAYRRHPHPTGGVDERRTVRSPPETPLGDKQAGPGKYYKFGVNCLEGTEFGR